MSEANWITIDAAGQSFGRLASDVAHKLQGKHLTNYTRNLPPKVDIVVINCDQLKVGIRLGESEISRHTGYIGNLKTEKFTDRPLAERFAKAVAHMVPQSNHGQSLIKHLHCYGGNEHPHAGQTATSKETTHE